MIDFLLIGALVVGGVWLVITAWLPEPDPDGEVNCTQDECDLYATHERFEGATTDGIPIIDLVCHRHAGTDGRPRW